jgi:hypothetical protein
MRGRKSQRPAVELELNIASFSPHTAPLSLPPHMWLNQRHRCVRYFVAYPVKCGREVREG